MSPISCCFILFGKKVLGASAGAGLLFGFTPAAARGGLGVNSLGQGVGTAQGFGMEALLTFVLVFVIFATVDESRGSGNYAPLAIGLTVGWAHFFGVSLPSSQTALTILQIKHGHKFKVALKTIQCF